MNQEDIAQDQCYQLMPFVDAKLSKRSSSSCDSDVFSQTSKEQKSEDPYFKYSEPKIVIKDKYPLIDYETEPLQLNHLEAKNPQPKVTKPAGDPNIIYTMESKFLILFAYSIFFAQSSRCRKHTCPVLTQVGLSIYQNQ